LDPEDKKGNVEEWADEIKEQLEDGDGGGEQDKRRVEGD